TSFSYVLLRLRLLSAFARTAPAALLTKGARWITVQGRSLAILTVALVVVITLASYAQLVVVNDKVVELRNELSELQSEERS
ncbi:MAG: hypothetical protein ACLR1T_18235, partial [Evtepia gabavorous]